jgi:hypothetical protein
MLLKCLPILYVLAKEDGRKKFHNVFQVEITFLSLHLLLIVSLPRLPLNSKRVDSDTKVIRVADTPTSKFNFIPITHFCMHSSAMMWGNLFFCWAIIDTLVICGNPAASFTFRSNNKKQTLSAINVSDCSRRTIKKTFKHFRTTIKNLFSMSWIFRKRLPFTYLIVLPYNFGKGLSLLL